MYRPIGRFLRHRRGCRAKDVHGGLGILGVPQTDLVYRVSCVVPTPYERSMKMVRFEEHEFPPPLDWIPIELNPAAMKKFRSSGAGPR